MEISTSEKMIIMLQKSNLTITNMHGNIPYTCQNSSPQGKGATRGDYEERADNTKDAAPKNFDTPNCGRKNFNTITTEENSYMKKKINFKIQINRNTWHTWFLEISQINQDKIGRTLHVLNLQLKGIQNQHYNLILVIIQLQILTQNQILIIPQTLDWYKMFTLIKFEPIFLRQLNWKEPNPNISTEVNFEIWKGHRFSTFQVFTPTTEKSKFIYLMQILIKGCVREHENPADFPKFSDQLGFDRTPLLYNTKNQADRFDFDNEQIAHFFFFISLIFSA